MIGGATRGSGGSRLGEHLADAKGLNEATWTGSARGLVSEGIVERIAELTDIGSHARSRTPLYHVHADPDMAWSDEWWRRYWDRVETEFGLTRQPYAEAVHVKAGRQHRHRVYSRVTVDGTCLRLDHDYARREKVNRLVELETGAALTPGRHNRAVVAALDAEGRSAEADALRSAGLDTIERPAARTTPRERAQAERTGIDPNKVGAAVLAAWRASDTGGAFLAALADQGLLLAQGDKVPVVIDECAGIHPLARLLAKTAKAEGSAPIRTGNVAARLKDVSLDRHVLERAASPHKQAATARIWLPIEPDGELTCSVQAMSPTVSPCAGAVGQVPENALTPAVSGADDVASRSANEHAATGNSNSGGPILGTGLLHLIQAPSAPIIGAMVGAEVIATVDARKLGDAARFSPQTNSAHSRRTAAVASARSHESFGAVHVPHQQQPTQKPNNALVTVQQRSAEPETEAMVHAGSPWGPAGNGRSSPRARSRPARAVYDLLWSDAGGSHLGGVVTAPRPAGASGRGRDVEGRHHDFPAGGDRLQSGENRGPADRDRVEACQIEVAMAARPDALERLRALTRLLSIPSARPGPGQPVFPDRLAALEDALAVSEARTAKVLSEEPWPNSRDRDARELSLVAQEAIEDEVRHARENALSALDRHNVAESKLGAIDRLARKIGYRTKAVVAIQELVDVAERLRITADTLSYFQDDRLDRADTRAADLARKRQAEQRRWATSSDVVRANRERRGNDLVRRTVDAGDVWLRDLAAHDLGAARDLLLRREQTEPDTTRASAADVHAPCRRRR